MILCYVHSQEGPWIPQGVSPTINGSSFNILWSTARVGGNTCWPLHIGEAGAQWIPRFSATSHFPIQTQWQACAHVTFVDRIREALRAGRQGVDGQKVVKFQPILVGEDNFLVWVIENQFLVDEVPYFLNKPIDGITILSPLFSDMSTFGWVCSCLLVGWPYFL